jgi:SAM-dependent methyltransferase
MRDAALPLLACPTCHGALTLVGESSRACDGHIVQGTIGCGCGARYPITGGIPRLVPGRVEASATETAARFGEQWKTFDHMSSYQEAWLAAWLAPLAEADFRGKTVFEGGCGKGRHTQVMAERWGVKDIVAVDLGEAVDVAFAHTRHLPNAHIVQGDLLQPPVRRGAFDVAFSVGVLHHLPDPRAGFDAVRAAVRPGGKVAIWVYGYEHNEWIVRFVNPVRERVTARMPARLLHALTLPPSAALAAWTKLYKTPLGGRLPYAPYMKQLAGIPLREVHNIVFDQLVTPLAFYLREDEVRAWFDVPGLADVQLGWHNQNSWRACATVTAS